MKSKKTAPNMTIFPKNLPTELFRLEESVGNFMQYWGFKKIHGRIWSHLYLSAIPLDTEELMRRLKVSKGLMSLAMRDLLEYNVIKQTSTGKHGTVFYTANDDLQSVILNVLKNREQKMLLETKSILDKLSKLKEADLQKYEMSRQKIKSASDLTSSAYDILSLFLLQSKCDGPELFSSITLSK